MKRKRTNPFTGKWRIVEVELWDRDFVNAEVPGYFAFSRHGLGEFQCERIPIL